MSTSFSESYAEAREKFLRVAADRGATVESVRHPLERGAQGEDLAMDFATFGDPAAPKTFFVVSGTHGQEGFAGSALQVEFLRNLTIPDGVNVVALHALNPWGFSHLSRTDHENIDVNRNFTDYGKALPQDELYPELFPALCPDDWTEETLDWSQARDDLASKHGMQLMQTTIGGGQIVEPTGLNYVGTGPSWSRTVVEDVLPRILGNATKIAFVEWHTGVGAWGELSHFCSLDPGSVGHKRVFTWLGDEASTSFSNGLGYAGGVAPAYRGWFSAWLPSTVPDADWAGLVIEVGTYDTISVVDGIRMDRWLKFGQGTSTTPREDIRRTMVDRLNPASPEWQESALRNGLDASRLMFDGLLEW